MKRYFFDVVTGSDSEFDYSGREFMALEDAIEFARLLATDLEIMQEGERGGSAIVVRDTHGRSYFSARVQMPELAAA
jgi:hypothetical protein